MSYTLIAVESNDNGMGEVGNFASDTIEGAEKKMEHWAKYGVEGQCVEPSELVILDAQGEVVRVWHWRLKRPVGPPFDGGGAEGD